MEIARTPPGKRSSSVAAVELSDLAVKQSWLGRISNRAGQRMIRKQEAIDIGTREVFAKLFQVVLFAVLFILLLQIMGINLTALAVFGGALGVGLAFGLQAIASNFISGIILLLDRSLKVGDYIELDDGRGGTIREMNMRSTLLETFDGKDIMVPNEQFITTRFVNWTHNNKEQRCSLEFQVAYKTDIPKMLDIVKQVVMEPIAVRRNLSFWIRFRRKRSGAFGQFRPLDLRGATGSSG